MNKPIGSNWDFTDAGWIFPYGFVMFAMLGGDFPWATGLLVVGNIILAAHVWYETKRNLPKKQQNTWRMYIVLAFVLSLFLAEPIMGVFAIVSYAVMAGRLKRGLLRDKVRKQYYEARVKTFQRMGIMIFATLCVFGVRYMLITDDVNAVREERLMKQGVIPRSEAEYLK